jgi:hypothetical protein
VYLRGGTKRPAFSPALRRLHNVFVIKIENHTRVINKRYTVHDRLTFKQIYRARADAISCAGCDRDATRFVFFGPHTRTPHTIDHPKLTRRSPEE